MSLPMYILPLIAVALGLAALIAKYNYQSPVPVLINHQYLSFSNISNDSSTKNTLYLEDDVQLLNHTMNVAKSDRGLNGYDPKKDSCLDA